MRICSMYYFENSFPIQYILEIYLGDLSMLVYKLYLVHFNVGLYFIKRLYHNLFCGIPIDGHLDCNIFGNMGKLKTLNFWKPFGIHV